MTNGEKIQKVFNCEVCEPIIEDDIIHVIFADKNDSAIGFDWSWWNAEYQEPTTPNDCETCIHNKGVLECDMYACKYEPTTKNENFGSNPLEWLGKNCKDCGNEKCKKLGTLPKGYDCALWQPESEGRNEL